MLTTMIQQNDWMVSMDLQDAYCCVLVHPNHRKYLRFWWEDTLYQYRSLPFGLSSSPRVFTKLLRPVVAFLRRLGVRLLIYLDDILLLNQSQAELEKDKCSVLFLLHKLGFVVNQKKSMLIPSQKIEYLGFVIDSGRLTLSLPPEKVTKIQEECRQVLQQRSVRVRQLSHLIGMLTATILAVLPAPLHYRHLQMQKSKALLAGHQNYNAQVVLDLECKSELKWWFRHLQDWNGKSLISPAPDLVITTDSSMMGWGAVCNGTTTQGLWSPSEKLNHINVLELKAAMFAVMAFAKNLSQIHIHLRLDNQASVAQINKLVTSIVPNHQGFLGFLPVATDHNYCRPCPRSPEPNSRSGIPGFSGQELLDTEQVIFSTNREDLGRGRYRSVCGPTHNPEEGLCQLETRSKSSDNGCIHNAVGRPKNVCVPPHFVWWVFA